MTDSDPPDPNTATIRCGAGAVVSVVSLRTRRRPEELSNGVVTYILPGNGECGERSYVGSGWHCEWIGHTANGSLSLVIQMQEDESINTTNTVAYGNEKHGEGFTTINNAGNYDCDATGAVSADRCHQRGKARAGWCSQNTAEPASATKGVSTYQVVLVPQYTSVTLGALTAAAWNGLTGGILALDVAGQLNWGGGTAIVDGKGFRGGAGMQLVGGVGGATNSDYRQTSPTTYTGAAGRCDRH